MDNREDLNQYRELWREAGVEDIKNWKLNMVPTTTSRTQKTRSPQNPEPAAQPAKKFRSLKEVETWLGNCTRCPLSNGRNKIVFGDGNAKAKLMFVGEGPGANEDLKGLPFVGRAGNLLTKIIEAMGYERKDVYIANTVKCRPPNNRTPVPEELEACAPFLKAQIQVIKPKIIVALGLPAATTLTGKTTSMAKMRSRFHPLAWDASVEVMPTYHPAYLLRNPPAKRLVWNDVKKVKAKLETLH